jgi:hypothetical protein
MIPVFGYNAIRRHVHLNPVLHHACFASATQKRNLRLDSAWTRADRWQEMSLRSFCRASFLASLADLLDPLSDLLDLWVGFWQCSRSVFYANLS